MPEAISLKLEVLEQGDKPGIGRIAPELIKSLDWKIGDVLLLGEKKSAVRILPLLKSVGLEKKETILLDEMACDNGGLKWGQEITVRRAKPQTAVKIHIKPNDNLNLTENELCLIRDRITGVPVFAGNKISINWKNEKIYLTIEKTIPEGLVVVSHDTLINQARTMEISYEQIGGLHKEMQKIKEMVSISLFCPELYLKLGINPPKGVILYGPPGTGKTLIARTIAAETGANFIAVNGPEIINRYYGESEKRLRAIFEEAAEKAPCLIFVDELDAICPRRDEVAGDVEKRVVAQLLALMDGLNPYQRVFMIGATNIIHVIDQALRRPGRFDREIYIGPPDKKGREAILSIHTKKMPLEDDVNIEYLAAVTHGYVGADLAALCREAAMKTLRKLGVTADEKTVMDIKRNFERLKVCQEDFLLALKEVEPSAIREILVELPEQTFANVGGLKDAKKALQEYVISPFLYKAAYEKMRSTPPRGVILTGPPGTGKTLLGRVVAQEAKVSFIPVKGPALLSKWVGESEKKIRELFQKAKQIAPCIIFLDEIDSLIPVRGRFAADAVTERVTAQLLTEMDGIETIKDIVVIGATNRLELVDPALLRPGRFELILELKLPTIEEREEILKIHLDALPKRGEIDFSTLARLTEGLSGADLASICHMAAIDVINGSISQGFCDDGRLFITQKDLLTQIVKKEVRS